MILADFNLLETALHAVRFVAGVGGAFVGWFLADPLARLVHRLISLKPIAPKLIFPCKVLGAGLLGMFVYFFIHLGGGGGLGWGPGGGAGFGKGPGTGGTGETKGETKIAKNDADNRKDLTKKAVLREPLEIEIISAKKYQKDERFYLLKRAPPALTLDEVKTYFDNNHTKIELHILQTEDSVGTQVGALDKLRETANVHRIPTLERTLGTP
jgi:hypothetical protein